MTKKKQKGRVARRATQKRNEKLNKQQAQINQNRVVSDNLCKNRDVQQIVSCLSVLMPEYETKRISYSVGEDKKEKNLVKIFADVHGMTVRQAKRFINNIINVVNRIGIKFKLAVIHGYNRGTAIKEMLATSFYNPHISYRYVVPNNQGITYMMVA